MNDNICAWIEARENELIALVKALIAAPSPNLPGDERLVTDVILAEMRRLGLGGAEVLSKCAERPNLVYRLAGRQRCRTLMLAGHSDTKPPGDLSQWETDPYEAVIRDGMLHGLGATDMKAAVAAMIYATAAVRELGTELAGDLLLVVNADEERSMAFGSEYLATECGLNADVALLGEPSAIAGDEFEYLHIASRGLVCLKVRVHGTQMHSSLTDHYPSVNACVELAAVLVRMQHELELTFEPHPWWGEPTVNLGVRLDGGVGYGVCPGVAEFQADIRTLPGMTHAQLETDIERVLDRVRGERPGLRVELEFEAPPSDWRPATEVSAEHPYVNVLLGVCERVLGRRPELSIFPGGTDAMNYQAKAGIPTIPSFGPGWLSRAHRPNECVGVASIVKAAKIYALSAAEYLA